MSDRTLIVSSASPDWKPLTDITWATMAKYATRHGYDFHTDVSNVVAPARSPMWGEGVTGYMPIRGFIKLDLLLHFLDEQSCRREYDWVVWFDADMLVTNYDIPLSRWMENRAFVLPFDQNAHNATVIMARNTDLNFSFLTACNTIGRTFYLREDWAEMSAMRFFLQTPPYAGMASYHSVQELCAMPNGVYPIHRRAREQFEWIPESLAVHFSALSLDLRVQMAREWTERLNLL